MSDWSERLSKVLRPEAFDLLRLAGRVAASSGASAYLVGGPVRDLALGRDIRDLDVVVEGDAGVIARSLASQIGGRVRTHPRFGTASIDAPDRPTVDLATARSESYPRPASLPVVRPSDLHDDLRRRDFTINAMAIHLDPDHFGSLVDPFGGVADLERRAIRVLHGRSFRDDPTRAFRAVRLATRLGFRMDPDACRRIGEAVRDGVFEKLSARRLSREIELLYGEGRARSATRALARLGLLSALCPAFPLEPRVDRELARADRVLLWHRGACVGDPVRGWTVPFGVLLRSSKRERDVVSRLRPDRASARILLASRSGVQTLRSRLRPSVRKASTIHAACRSHVTEILLIALAVFDDHRRRRAIRRFLVRLRHEHPDIRGTDLLERGVPRGPAISRGLEAALRAKLDGLARGRESQLAAAIRSARRT